MQRFKTFLTVVGAVSVLVLAGNTVALAATGHAFILGKANKANKITTLARTTKGTALKVQTKSDSNAPLAVNGKGRVANLNADLLDGVDSTALRTGSFVFTKSVPVATSEVVMTLPLPAGTYVIGYDIYMVSGGLNGSDADCYLWRQRGGSFQYYGESLQPTTTGASVTASATTVVTLVAGDSLKLRCSAPANWTTDAVQPMHVYATRTAVLGGGALRLAPTSAGARR
jgi:hypothetical protein